MERAGQSVPAVWPRHNAAGQVRPVPVICTAADAGPLSPRPDLKAAGCFACALALFGLAAVRRARLSRVLRGMPNALAVWDMALYCERCDGVFFPPGFARPDAGRNAGRQARDLMTAADFQRLVWSAGGYGGLRSPRRGLGSPDPHPDSGPRAAG